MAEAQGRVIGEVTVPLPRETATDVAALRGDPSFAALRAELAEVTRRTVPV
ncbi:hypothetical protein ACFVY1_22820 [Streptomyces sp. NPDC058293]|uniref:hypothetical protein n=1 Tax=unclassified Streptomyces TaxID=2593676 RepID=UPI00224F3049|nr:hypothetical protein [Streptomyces sp. NBC_01446]MCX4648825.1 hypothetical protein [Streptomyces sp. NBC_01446]